MSDNSNSTTVVQDSKKANLNDSGQTTIPKRWRDEIAEKFDCDVEAVEMKFILEDGEPKFVLEPRMLVSPSQVADAEQAEK
ncbi:hypothetical protein [Halolamina salifodinae]|uniref:Bifunctional DNA-binding transcriptional regulator/antitoxin component of YhaV-PrlF toxin-antitoxin module n=1 Tax=Halolamina salifodinae TaxID=1202767 RepID=A0A8T4H055_9EURY|nr:hypothetical protein [Halolamina salifodinae]MBP1986975.1 bifunctional DNA-binding transcriptional regulator/antitoxin component of YhaV-PrlF toxin-antitoxin module [Halolamina salifodinae]